MMKSSENELYRKMKDKALREMQVKHELAKKIRAKLLNAANGGKFLGNKKEVQPRQTNSEFIDLMDTSIRKPTREGTRQVLDFVTRTKIQAKAEA